MLDAPYFVHTIGYEVDHKLRGVYPQLCQPPENFRPTIHLIFSKRSLKYDGGPLSLTSL